MEGRASDIVKQLYGAASIPVAAADEKFSIIWKNSAAETSELFDDDHVFVGRDDEAAEGIKSVFLNGAYHLFNIIKCAAEDICFIIEYVGRDTSRDISYMKDYFSFLCTRLRESASQISMAADDIDLFVKSGDTNIASPLNRINRNVMLLLKEVVIPENIFYASAPECRDEPINLAHEVAASASDAQTVLGRWSEVWQNSVDNVCAAVNASVFEAAVACMTVQACCGEPYPEKLEFAVERDSENEERGIVSVRSVCLSGKSNNPFRLEPMKKNDFFTDVVFREILAEKYGMSFETEYYPDGIECIMYLDVLPEEKGIVQSQKGIMVRQERFSSMAVSLSEKHCAEHYKNIKME